MIIIERNNAALWKGSDGSHYDDACSVSEYAEEITVENFKTIVLGDEPLQTTVFDKGKNGILIARWRFADSEADVLQLLPSFNGQDPIEQFNFSWEATELVLFDAVEVFELGTDYLSFKLLKKDCLFETFEFNPQENLSLLLHKISYL